MKEARNAIIVILILLFIIAGIGVAISRVADREKAENVVKTEDQRGWLERIFLRSKSTTTAKKPSTATETPSKMVITSESESVTEDVSPRNSGAVAGTTTYTTTSGTTTATSIPATGAPIGVILTSLMGLAGGVYLRRKA
jgi:hypothetical protein